MSYDTYLEKYSDKFAILGGVCVQSAIGLLPKEELESEIRRVFGKLRGKGFRFPVLGRLRRVLDYGGKYGGRGGVCQRGVL